MALILSRKLFINSINKSYRRFISNDCHYDIIIAGGGMVGTSLACALGKKPQLRDKQILLLESGKEFNWQPSETYSNRVVALTPSTKRFFESLGAWKTIENCRYGSVKKLQVWDACSDAMISFNNDDMIDHVAYIVENNLILAALNDAVQDFPNVTISYDAKIDDFKFLPESENAVEVIMENDKSYTCSLLLGADGVKSKVRELIGSQYLNWNYNQMGVVATLYLSEAEENVVAWQRFLPTGPVALLPLNENQSSLVWTTTIAHAKKLLKLEEEQFVDELNTALWKVYEPNDLVERCTKSVNSFLESLNLPSNAVRQLPPSIKAIEPNSRAAFPLGFGHSTNYVAKNVALVGDAAHRVHPLAGQGVNLGFGDADCLANLLAETVYSGINIGSLTTLKKYETLRQRYNVPTMLAIDGLQKLYCTQLTPIVLLRSIGLQITHALNPVKKMIMNHTVG